MSGRPTEGASGHATRSNLWIARAGLLAAALMLIFALPGPRRPAEPCPHPAENRAQAGRSVEVVCRAAAFTGASLRGPTRLLFGLSIDPNRADLLTLEALPGIGPARAHAILRERERQRFESLGDLLRVRGIGPRTLERLAGLVAVMDTPR